MEYNIGQVVKKLKVNKETIRYYERIGLLKDIKRDSNGYRIYTDHDIEILQFIFMTKEYNFTLKEIELLLEKVFPKANKLNQDEIIKLIDDKTEEIDKNIEELMLSRKVLIKIKNNLLSNKDICYQGKSTEEILNL